MKTPTTSITHAALSLTAILFAALFFTCSTPVAAAQAGYGPPSQQRLTCSSNNGRRNWCNIGPTRDVRLIRQISGSPCVRGNTWGIDQRGLWVDRGCRAEFVAAFRPPPPPLPPPPSVRIVTCSSNDGRRNWCDVGRSRNIRLALQISGSACIQGSTWGTDRRGLWVDRGCRADFRVR